MESNLLKYSFYSRPSKEIDWDNVFDLTKSILDKVSGIFDSTKETVPIPDQPKIIHDLTAMSFNTFNSQVQHLMILYESIRLRKEQDVNAVVDPNVDYLSEEIVDKEQFVKLVDKANTDLSGYREKVGMDVDTMLSGKTIKIAKAISNGIYEIICYLPKIDQDEPMMKEMPKIMECIRSSWDFTGLNSVAFEVFQTVMSTVVAILLPLVITFRKKMIGRLALGGPQEQENDLEMARREKRAERKSRKEKKKTSEKESE